MNRLRTFQAAAHESGFVNEKPRHDGTVLWLRRETSDPKSKTHQRICMDTLTVSATVYSVDSRGNPSSKSFRQPLALKEWLALDQLR
jgi:hypothetical protein